MGYFQKKNLMAVFEKDMTEVEKTVRKENKLEMKGPMKGERMNHQRIDCDSAMPVVQME